MVAILEKSEHNIDFHPIVDFIESTARIETTEEGTKILATVDGILRTVTESSLGRNLKLQNEEGISSLHDTELFENLTLMGYNISPNQKLTFQKNEPASPLRDVNKGEAWTTESSLGADQDRANIAKTSTLPHDSAPKVTSPAAAEGTQELEINKLKARFKLLEDRERVNAKRSGDDALIKERNLDEGKAAAERVSDDTEEMATVLTFMDVATILASGVADVPTSSGSIPTASPPTAEVPTGIDVVPTDMCGVHQVTSKDKEIFMLVEKDYPLRKGLAIVMICYKLQVENYSQMANDLILKIYKIANCLSQQGD
nr:hypothetical protein [Tanacetum cinerariifolium]